MRRRDLCSALAATVAAPLAFGAEPTGTAATPAVRPVEGRNYERLRPPQPAPAGRIEVLEFFWYGCPHCYAFEPALDAWARALPPDVSLRRVPVAFQREPYGTHQRLYYALEALGVLDTMHRKVFDAIHQERLRLVKADEIAAFVKRNGLDPARVAALMQSFGVESKSQQATATAEAYRLDGVPSMAVQGSYYISGSMTGGNDGMLPVVDYLIGRVRRG